MSERLECVAWFGSEIPRLTNVQAPHLTLAFSELDGDGFLKAVKLLATTASPRMGLS